MKCFPEPLGLCCLAESTLQTLTMYFCLVLTPGILRAQTKHTSKFLNSLAIAINDKHVIKMDDDNAL